MTWTTYIRSQALGMAAVNALCNASHTWFLWRDESMLRFDAVGADLSMTPIWIGLLSVLLGTPFIRKSLAGGRMIRDAGIRPHPLAVVLPKNVLLRNVVVATSCALLFAVPLALVLPLLGDGMLTAAYAVATKIVITIAFSVIIVPIVIHATVRDVPSGAIEATSCR